MKSRLRVHCVVLGLVLLLTGCSRGTFQDAQGRTLDWGSLRGQWVLVNYWATWCQPCYQEVPELNNLDQAPEITVIGVNYDGLQGERLDQAISKMAIHFRVLTSDPGQRFGWSQPVGLPASFLVNPDGELAEARFGRQTRAGILARIRGDDGGSVKP